MPEKDKDIFEEEFSKDEVVNSDSSEEFPFTEFEKKDVVNKNETDLEAAESIKEQLVDSEDLQNIITHDEDAKRAIDLINKVGGKKDSKAGVIKKEDASQYTVKETADPEDFMSKDKKDEFLDNSNLDEDQVDHFIKIPESQRRKKDFESENNDKIISEEELLRKNFQDYLLAKRLSGRNPNSHGNLINKDNIQDKGNISEFTDNHGDFDEDHNTTVEINRTSDGELESIIVYCKCGEKTVINLEYEEEGESNTEIINEDTEIKPLQNVYNEEFRNDYDALNSSEGEDEININDDKSDTESFKDDDVVDKITRNTKYKDFDNPDKEAL